MNRRWSLVWMTAAIFTFSSAAETARAAETIDPSGTWTWLRELEGQEAQSVVTLSYKDGKLTGFYKRVGQIVPISNGKVEKNEVTFDADGKWNDQKVHGKFKGKVSHSGKQGDEINGTIEIVIEDGSLPLAWSAKRGIDADDVTGTWKLKLATPDGSTADPQLKLSTDAGNLKGTCCSSRFGEQEAKLIKLDGSQLSWMVDCEHNGQTIKCFYKGKLEAGGSSEAIKGTLTLESAGSTTTVEFTGERLIPPTQTAQKPETTTKSVPTREKESKPNAKPADGKSTERTPAMRRVIVMLKSGSEILVVYSSASSGRGPMFSILSTAGKEIAKELSLKDLQAAYPHVFEEYRTSFANLSADSL